MAFYSRAHEPMMEKNRPAAFIPERSPTPSRPLGQQVHPLHQLQRSVGNRAVGLLLRKAGEPCLLKESAILFGISSASVTGAQAEIISCFVRQWQSKGGTGNITVDGYASVDGPEESNMSLSTDRAVAVQKKLLEHGVPAEKISLRGLGETQAFSKDYEPNRRVVLKSDAAKTAPPAETPQPGPSPTPQPGPAPVPSPSGTGSPLPVQAPPAHKVATLCHRDFTGAVGSYVPARHCFVWGHDDTLAPTPSNIAKPDTITYDNSTSGTPDPDPHKATTCTGTYNVDPATVKANYIRMCDPGNYNLTSFNCCTCAYMALTAAGASPSASDFPAANHGMGLPFGSGLKRDAAETLWLNDIDEIEDVVTALSNADIRSLSLDMKRHWVERLISGVYCTENEGNQVIRIFRNSTPSQRRTLYRMIEGHTWNGDWVNGVFVTDDDMVDALSGDQLKTLKDLINE